MFVGIGRGPRPRGADGPCDLLLACHDRIRHFLALARRVGEQPAPASDVGDAARSVARYFAEAFPLHVADEEESLRPRLAGRDPTLDAHLAAMAHDHGAHDPLVARLVAEARALARAPTDPARRSALHAAAVAATRRLEPHLAFEERTIFPAVAGPLVDPAEAAAIVAEIRARRAGIVHGPERRT